MLRRKKLLDADKLSFWLKKEEKVILVAAVGYPNNTLNLLNYNIGEGVTGYIAEGHDVIGNWNDLQSKPYWKGKWDALIWKSEHPYDSFSFIGVPILLNKKPIGLLKAERINSNIGDFNNSDLKVLKSLALAASTAIRSDSTIFKNQEMPYIFVLMPFSQDFIDI